MATDRKTKLAKTVNAQINPNTAKLIDWKNCDKALTESTKTYATSYATRKIVKDKIVDNHPYTLTAHKFGLNIPSNAYIKNIEFLVHMRTRGKYKVWKPPEARFNIYGKAYSKNHDEKRTVNTTGWEKGIYYVDIGGKFNLSSSWQTYSYTMDETQIKKGGFKASDFNEEVMGVDLKFFNPVFFADTSTKKEAEAYIDVAWVKLIIIYEVPTYNITYKVTETNGRVKCVKATFTNSSKANGGSQVLDVDIPWGTELISPTSTTNGFNPSTRKWTVNAKANAKTSVDFCIATYLDGEQNLYIGNDTTKRFPFKYYTPNDLDDGYDDISLSLESEPHKNHRECLIVSVEGQSTDDTLTLTPSMSKGFTNIGWTLDNASSGVSVSSTSGSSVTLTVPPNERFTAYLRYCFIPTATGSYVANVEADDGKFKILEFDVANPYIYHIGTDYKVGEQYANITTDSIKLNVHRVASEVGTNATVIPIRSDENDAVMHITPCGLHLKRWAELNYIGCVPLEHLHFDPKSTYKDKLLDTHYKNKRYMGKQLASDEDITLNVRLHPQQVTTIQGLIDMDKPIPINANHKIWEGDALNHRGWAEIYGITATKTNEHWYKCEIDVKYLTHNLNTRFKIDRGNKVNTQSVNDMMVQAFERGEKLSEDITQGFFSVVTDGTYMYNTSEVVEVDYLTNEGYEVVKNGNNAQYTDSSGNVVVIDTLANFVSHLEDNNYDVIVPTTNGEAVKVKALLDVPTNQRNMFSLDNNQYVDIKTRETLGASSEVIFDWSNVILDELRENNVERIVELVDKSTNQAVFKYQYSDFIFDYDDTTDPATVESVRASPIAYALKNGDWVTYTEEITLDTIIETGGIIDDSDEATPIDTSADDEYQDDNSDSSELMIGSTVHFILDNHKLKVIDEGFNSREWEVPDIELEGESYYWRTIWTNKNSDGETNDVVCFFDFSVSNTILETQYADKYSKLVVSPFPVSDKTLIFSREAEEGTVYYYEDDKEEFTYLVEPYYQYMNGTDLVTDSGISIFNLNYGYKLVYIQNGLVRLGFDRLDGRLYLGKYDPVQHEYVTVTQMKLDKYSDINIKSITDDKIEIQASDSVFTIFRGHPYIMINHPTEDILIDTRFGKVWAESVGGGDAFDLPSYWDLMNNANILPSCVGGTKEIRSSCIEVENVDDESKTATSLDWATGSTWTGFEVDTDLTFNLSSSNLSESDTIDIGSGHCVFGDYTMEIGHDYSVVTDVALIGDSIIQNGDSGILKAKVTGYDYTPIADKSVDFIQKNKQLWSDTGSNNATLRVSTSTSGVNRTVTATSDSGHFFLGSNSRLFDLPIIVEFDVTSRTVVSNGGIAFDVYDGTNEKRVWINQTGHYKIQIDENGATALDGSQSITQSGSDVSGTVRASIYCSKNTDTVTFKDLTVTGDDKVYPITDTLFSDKGITGDTNPNWYDNSYGTVSVGSDGTLLTSSDTTNFLMHNASNSSHTSSDQYIWNAPFVVEFDVVSMSGTGTDTQFQVYSDETTKNWATGLSGTGHYKAIVLDDNQRLYKDGELQTNFQSYSLPNCRITLRVRNNVSLKYKNFKVYEIAENSITDANGIATCNIVGDGSGAESYCAKTTALSSNQVDVIDGLVRDYGITGKSNVARYNEAYVTVDVDISGTSVFNNGSSTRSYWWNKEGTSTSDEKDWDVPLCIEFDYEIINNSGASYQFWKSNTVGDYESVNLSQALTYYGLTSAHIKMILTSSKLTIYVDDNKYQESAVSFISSGLLSCRFVIGGNASFKYKNYVHYPIEIEEEPTPVTPTVTTVTLTTSSNTITYGSSVTLSATVKDENNTAMSGQTVTFLDGGTSIGTGTTNDSGVATLTKSDLSVATHTITASCSSVTSSSVSVTVNAVPVATTLTLTSNKDVLSAYDSETATLTATVLDQNNTGMSGQSVVFKKGSTTLDTVSTNSSGVATYDYSASGSGDVTITVECESLTETQSIEDCIFFDATETTKGTASSVVIGDVYNSLNIPTLPNHFVWEIDMKVSSTSGSEDRMFFTPTSYSGEQPPNALWVEFGSSSTGMRIGSRRSSTTYNTGSGKSYSANTYYHFKVERNGNTITGYIDDSNRGTLTESWIDNYSSWWFSYTLWKRSNINMTWKNLKIKPL